MGHKIKILVFGVIIVGIILGGSSLYNLAEQKESGVNIAYDVVCTQGAPAENLTGMESVKVHGTVWNIGDKEAKNVTVTVIFTDAAHDKVVRKTVVEGVDLLPEGAVSVEFDAEYLRELTIPKTLVEKTIQVNWIEDGQLKTLTSRKHAAATEEEKQEETLSVSELLENPVYDTEVKVYGRVSALGELFCPCFALTSDGKMLTLHYDLMVEDDGTERPAVSVEGIENGNWVIVTGELRSSTGTAPSTTFWASNIEKIIEEDEVVSLANVNDIEIMLLESFPVQVNVVARGEHPDSCTEVDKITTRREGTTFFVTIATSRPADAICAQVITPFEEVIALDVVGLKAGVYTVDVNGARDTFELQIDNIFENDI